LIIGGEQFGLDDAQMVIDYANALISGEELMFTIDIPYIPPQQDTIELAQAETENRQPDYLVKGCNPVNSDAKWGGGVIDPITSLLSVVKESITIDSQFFSKRPSSLRGEVTLLGQVPQFKHGKLEAYTHPEDGTPYYFFKPEAGYVGKDYGTFMARFDGKYYKIVIEVSMHPDYDESHNYPDSLCPWPLNELIKIEKPTSGENKLNFDWSAVSIKHGHPYIKY
jgi:hypothetical protein